MTTTYAYPYSVPSINYLSGSVLISSKYKYTYVSYASYPLQTVTSGVTYSGVVELSTNYSDSYSNYRYFVHASFEAVDYLYNSQIQVAQPSNIIICNKLATSGKQFNWYFRNTGVTLTLGGYLRFIIFFYSPELIGATNSLVTTQPVSTSNGIPKDTNFLSDLFNTVTPPEHDFANFFPLVSYASYTYGSSSAGIDATVSIVNYGTSNYTVLYEFGTGTSAPAFNTRYVSMNIYTDKKTPSSFRFYFVNNTGAALPTLVINFIIFYYG